jgi:hypothetical protein
MTQEDVRDRQVDVKSTLRCKITILDQSGWEARGGIYEVYLSAWFDEGDDERFRYYSATDSNVDAYYCHNDSRPGANFNFKMVYNNDRNVFNMLWPLTGEITLHPEFCGYELIDYYTGSVWFIFTLGNQTRHASGPGSNWLPGPYYNDPYSWNINITVIDREGYDDSTIGEFGVYRYTEIHIGDLYPELEGIPGVRANTPTFWLRDISNDAYWLNVSIKSDLRLITDRTVRIGTSHMSFNSTTHGDGTQNITGGNTGWSGVFRDSEAPSNGTYQEAISCRYELFIPIGTPGGTYTAAVLYTIMHKS